MANYSYEELLNDNVRFLQGTQAQLNKYLPNSTDPLRGNAKEGAFYLTTDTHRLYVGRKVTTGADADKIFPVQVSAGITTVVDSGALPAASADAQKGDFYYIQEGNILAVLEENPTTGAREWVQINPATGLTSFTQSATQSGSDALLSSSLATQAGSKSASFKVAAGANVTVTANGSSTDPTITIAAKDTTYTAGTAAATVNGAKIGLKKDAGTSLDSTVTITGENDIGVTSTDAGTITVKGPNFTDKGIAASNLPSGFKFQLEFDSGNSTSGKQTITHATSSELDPTITIGATTGYQAPTTSVTFQKAAAVHFLNGNADLNVYTKEQTDQAITDAVAARLRAADAMEYCGTITETQVSKLGATGADAIEAHNGDTYKASADFTYNGTKVKVGDLLILHGTENASGVIPSANLEIDIIPSGDEPYIAASFSGDTVGNYDKENSANISKTVLNLVDSKASNNVVAGVTIPNTEKIKVISTVSGTNQERVSLNIEHRQQARTDNNGLALVNAASGATDTIDTYPVTLFVLNEAGGIKTDDYGHITGVEGKTITFKHNRLTSLTTAYNSETLGSGSTLLSKAFATVATKDGLNLTNTTNVHFESNTLHIDPNAGKTALAIDIKWGSF